MAILTVIKTNGTSVALPDNTLKAATASIYDLDDGDGSGRNQAGEMFRDRIAVKRKVQASWGLLTPSEMSTILNAISETFFDLVYPDPLTGQGRRMTVYVGDRSAPLYRSGGTVTAGTALSGMWEGLSVDFIEK